MGRILLDPKLDSKVPTNQAMGIAVKLENLRLSERVNTQ